MINARNLWIGVMAGWLGVMSLAAQSHKDVLRRTDSTFFQTEEARRVGEQVLLYQRTTGGWPKNIDMAAPLSGEQRAAVLQARGRRNDSTTDNGATTQQMAFLARLYQAQPQDDYRHAFCRAVEYLLSGQYENGGWPQFWPENRGYQVHITYNDDAMVNTLRLLRDIAEQREPYGGALTPDSLRQRAQAAFRKGVECILATQIRVNGEPTVWCQQHDRVTLLPAGARSYELPSFCAAESAAIVRLLMEIPEPDERIRAAVRGAMNWFTAHQIAGFRYERAAGDSRLIPDSTAGPLWARFYDLEHAEPFFCDRDGIPRRRLEDIGQGRRGGYAWYTTRPASLFPLYEQWQNHFSLSPAKNGK